MPAVAQVVEPVRKTDDDPPHGERDHSDSDPRRDVVRGHGVILRVAVAHLSFLPNSHSRAHTRL